MNVNEPSRPLEGLEPRTPVILVADDDRDILEIIGRNLRSEGYTVHLRSKATDVLEAFHQVHPDLVILDIMMPLVDGFCLCTELKLLDDSIPVVLLTAHTEQASLAEGYRRGADDYITKPVEKVELLARLTVLLRLKRAMDRLRSLDRVKSDFLSTASHELQSPLATIMALSENMTDGLYGPIERAGIEALEEIKNSTKAMGRLIDHLLDLGAFDEGVVRTNFGLRSLGKLLEDCHHDNLARAMREGIAFRLDLPPSLPGLWIDPRILTEILANLVSNAFKFCNRGDTVTLSAVLGPARVEISVSDSGPGIPQTELCKLFERFSKTSVETKKMKRGSGLGLAIARKNVELHGGRIWVVSEVGKGTTFTFSLPLVNPLKLRGEGGQILIVDDDPLVRRTLRTHLLNTPYAWQIIEVESGQLALKVLDSRPVQLILCDFYMPGMDGMALLRICKQRFPTIPFVIVTGYADLCTARLSIQTGADGYLKKPFKIQDVRSLLDKLFYEATRRPGKPG